MQIDIRSFVESDCAQARALWSVSPGVGLSETDGVEALGAFLARNPGTSFVALVGGQLVGTILCGHDGRRGLIHHLVTAPSHRRLGVATALLRAGLDALRAQGIGKCHLLVFRANEDGLKFWCAAGARERTELALFSLPTTLDP